MQIAKSVIFCFCLGSFSVFAHAATPQWQIEMNERAKELENLQKQNGANKELRKTDFPKTVQDLSFSARQQLKQEGLEPFKDMKAYRELNVKNAEEWCEEHKNSRECWEWRCGTNGKDSNKSECISYRCQKDDYYKTHTEECETNKPETQKKTQQDTPTKKQDNPHKDANGKIIFTI